MLFVFGYCSLRADDMSMIPAKVDLESLEILIEEIEVGSCLYGEMPEIQFSLYYCRKEKN
jgi:hypothetical protein